MAETTHAREYELATPSQVKARSGGLGILTGPVARVIYALPFGIFGINHFMFSERMTELVPTFIPGSYFWVYFTGVAHILAALAIITGRFVLPAAIGLAIMLCLFVLTIHIPGLANPDTMAISMTALLKDTALAGAALMAIRAVGRVPNNKPPQSA